MNIALFTDAYLPDINGVATSTYILHKELIRHGHNVVVVTTRLPEGSDYVDEDYVIRISGVEIKKLYGYRLSSFYSIKGMKELKEFEPDVIHIQTEFSIGIFGKLVAEMLNIPVCYTYHTMWADYAHYISKSQPGQAIVSGLIKKMSKVYGNHCAELIVPSDKTKEALEGYGVTNDTTVVPTGLLLDQFSVSNMNIEKVKEIRDEYELNDKFVIIFLGRIAKEKSVDLVVNTVMEIDDPNIVLMIVGGGPDLEGLMKLTEGKELKTHIYFTGPKNSEQVPSYYHASDLFISASTSETQGLTYIEAMASSLPVIARYDMNLKDVIIDGVNGYFFYEENELRPLIEKMRDSDLTELKKGAIEESKKYSSEVFYERIIDVYRQAIDKNEYKYEIVSLFEDLDNCYTVILNSGRHDFKLTLNKRIIERYGLIKGKIVDRATFDALYDHQQVRAAYNYALKLLTTKDYTYTQIQKKILDRGLYDEIQVDMTMNLLLEKGLIDDHKYVENYLSGFRSSNKGIEKLVSELRQVGISPYIIDECLLEYTDDIEIEKAEVIVKRMFEENTTRSKNALILNIRNKLFRRGFQKAVIDHVIDEFDFTMPKEHTLQLLRKEYLKVYSRYSVKYDEALCKNKIISFLVRKGYDYDDIKEIMYEEELNEKD